jgi:hypothetical protein
MATDQWKRRASGSAVSSLTSARKSKQLYGLADYGFPCPSCTGPTIRAAGDGIHPTCGSDAQQLLAISLEAERKAHA